MIGDALRNTLPPSLNRNFVNSVSQAIAKEDLPAPIAVTPVKQKTNRKRHAVINPLSGFAIAASVAVVAYLGVGMITVDEQLAAPSLASNSAENVPAASDNSELVLPATSNSAQVLPATSIAQSFMPQSGFRTVQGQQWQTVRPAVESRLKNYLYSHRYMTGSTAMSPAVMPQARLVVIQPGRE